MRLTSAANGRGSAQITHKNARRNHMNKQSIYELLDEEIMNSDLPEDEKNRRLSALLKASGRKINLMIVGATGVGKSSTVNSMFNTKIAEVGVGVESETAEMEKYELENLTIWDTPGLGNGADSDKAITRKIVEKLSETAGSKKSGDGKGFLGALTFGAHDEGAPNLLIDLVLVVLDASSKDLTTPCELIGDVLLPCLGEEGKHRILIGINQADMAMKGRHWDYEENRPDSVLEDFLKQKADLVRERILNAAGIEVSPVYYCAGYTEDDGAQRRPYNLTKLFYNILMAVPAEKRLALAGNLNEDERMWEDDDREMNYKEEINKGFFEGVLDSIGEGAEKGAITGGCILGIPGMVVGGLVGAILGGIAGLIVKPLTGDAA
jgi:predicted GTPase